MKASISAALIFALTGANERYANYSPSYSPATSYAGIGGYGNNAYGTYGGVGGYGTGLNNGYGGYGGYAGTYAAGTGLSN